MSGSRRLWCSRCRCCCSCRSPMPSRLPPGRAGCVSCRSSAGEPSGGGWRCSSTSWCSAARCSCAGAPAPGRKYDSEAHAPAPPLMLVMLKTLLRTALPVLVSGTAQEALAMRTSLARDFGVEVRWVEGRSRDTFENAQFSAPLLKATGVSRIILVTDGAHAWRAAHEFAGTGLAVVPAPVGLWAPRETGMQRYLPSTAALDRSRSALYELLGDLVRRVLAALHLRRHTAWTAPG